MADKRKPERADVVIIGAGASGGAAAKVLAERGMRVVALERGPWRKKESFGGDELANVNRYNLWPDPILNPRTYRETANDEAHTELFCPVPQMVGGGTVHWQGWLPRFTPNDFKLRSIAGEVPGTTLVDWPISYDDLEPYYTKVEWAFGVSGAGGVNKYEGYRSKDYPTPPMPATRYGKSSTRAAEHWGTTHSPRRWRHCHGHIMDGRPPFKAPSRNSTATRLAHDPVRCQSGSHRRWRPTTSNYGPIATCTKSLLDAAGRAKSVVYQDGDGDMVEQEGDIIILACGAVESARLLLLSKSSRFPTGLANGSDLVGRNATFHEYSAAIGVFEDPIYAWAGGGYVAASSYEFYEHDPERDFVGGCHIASAGVGIPLPINCSLPDRPMWGSQAKQMDRDSITTVSPSGWCCTICHSMKTVWNWTIQSRMPGVYQLP